MSDSLSPLWRRVGSIGAQGLWCRSPTDSRRARMFLVEQGRAERRGQRVVFMRNLLATLRSRDVEQTAREFEVDSGFVHRPAADGQHVSGVYTRSVALVSGRFAVLEDGAGFSLVPRHRKVWLGALLRGSCGWADRPIRGSPGTDPSPTDRRTAPSGAVRSRARCVSGNRDRSLT